MKHVPRWACGEDALDKIIQKQQMDKSNSYVFGALSSNYVTRAFDLKKIFSKGEDAQSYMQEERGSSADWNDASEFGSPKTGHARLDADRRNNISMSEARPTRPNGIFANHQNVSAMIEVPSQNRFSHISEEPNSE